MRITGKKMPWFKFYADRFRSSQIHECKPDVRALYVELCCIAWELSDEKGYLVTKGSSFDEETLQILTKFSPKRFEKCFQKLFEIDALKRDTQGITYVPDLVQLVETHEEMTRRGVLGGNPALKRMLKQKDKQLVNLGDKPEEEEEEDKERGKTRSRYRTGTPIDQLPGVNNPPGEERGTYPPPRTTSSVEDVETSQSCGAAGERSMSCHTDKNESDGVGDGQRE